MKRYARSMAMAAIALGCLVTGLGAQDGAPGAAKSAEPRARFVIADFNRGDLFNNLNGDSGTWEMDPADRDQSITASLDEATRMGSTGAALKLDYCLNSTKNAMNGIWTHLGSFDASSYDHFEFWVKGDAKAGFTTVFKIEFKKIRKTPEGGEDTIKASYIVRNVTADWQKVSIPLNVMNGILDWQDMREFVITFEKKRADKPEGALYFDDFAFTNTGDPGPKVTDIVPHRKKKSDKDLSPEEFARLLVGRLNGFPEKVFVARELPQDDRAFLTQIARDTWGYFDKIVDREHQLPLDNIEFAGEKTISAATKVGDYTNITNVGVYLMCLVSGFDFGFITKDEAVKRLEGTIDAIEKLPKHKNFPYNYYDITIFQETSNFISYVDTGWLVAGLIVAKNAFPAELGARCQKLIDSMDFSFFYDPVEEQMYHGFYTNIDYYSEYHYGVFYTEPRAVSFIAVGKGDVPKQHWFSLVRTFPEDWVWQTQMPKNRKVKEYLGCVTEGGYYTYETMQYVPSWGGSMFEALMPTIIIDEKGRAPKGLGMNDAIHAKIQAVYALDKLRYPVWGMSPSCVPGGGYSEYGVKPLGTKGYKVGVVTPHATFLALEFIPQEAVANLRKMLSLYTCYGEYGFYDAINVETGAVATKYLCLDQAMSFIALNNYLNDGAIRKRFHADPIAKRAEDLLQAEDFLE